MNAPLARRGIAAATRRDRMLGLGVCGVALALRVWAALDARDAPFWRTPFVDETAYLELARGISSGTPPPHGAWYVAPGYAYWLALLSACGGGIGAAKLANLAAGVACAWLVWKLARRVASRGAAFAAGVAYALYPAALLQELLVLKSALAVLCLLLALVTLPWPCAPQARPPAWRWGLSGVWLGLATLLRGEMLLLALVLAASGWWARARRWPGAPAAHAPALCLVAVALCVAVPTAQNRARGGDWVVVAFGGGANFYIGNHAGADGGYVPLRPDRSDPPQEETDAVLLASGALRHVASPAEVSRYWFGRGFDWWRRAPARALALSAKKWAMLWGPWEMSDVLSTALAARWVRLLRDPIASPALFLPAALAGVWMTRRRRELWPLQAFLVGAQVAIVPFFLFERFRLHLVAAALPFAAVAAQRAWELARARRWRRLALGAVATAAAAAALGAVRAPRDEAVLHVNLGGMFYDAGQYEAALREFETVRTLAPHAWRVDIDVANAEVALRHPAAALAALQRVLPRLEAEAERTRLPSAEELAYCHELAGDLEHDGDDRRAAAAHYLQALRYAPPAAQAALRAKLAACGDAAP